MVTGVMSGRLDRSSAVDQALVTAASEAPRDADLAFERLYRSSRDDVYAYVASLLRDRSAAEEVTAAAFERAYRKRSAFDRARGEPRAWLFGIARNAALDELRRRQRLSMLVADPEDPGDADVVATAEDDDLVLRRTAIRAALATLSARDREVIALKFHAGLNNSELAKVLGVSESNAGTILHRSVQKLRRALGAPV
jgi:RNA polymerase sigma-70 factor (ECF subfamily)